MSHTRNFTRIDAHRHLPRHELTASGGRAILFRDDCVVIFGGISYEIARVDLRSVSINDGAILLGDEEQQRSFLVPLNDDDWPAISASFDRPFELMTFREAATRLPASESELLAYSFGMINWSRRSRFCPACGAPTKNEAHGHVKTCTGEGCGVEWYPRLDPVVIMLITFGERILLARHRRQRSSGFFSTIAGFVEPGETLEAAAEREMKEEVGLGARAIRYLGSQPWPLPASLMIGFEIEAETDRVVIDELELLEARWFRRDEIRDENGNIMIPLAGTGSIARMMIESWLNSDP